MNYIVIETNILYDLKYKLYGKIKFIESKKNVRRLSKNKNRNIRSNYLDVINNSLRISETIIL